MKKAKTLPPQVKFQIALEALKGEKGALEFARAYGLHPKVPRSVHRKAEREARGAG